MKVNRLILPLMLLLSSCDRSKVSVSIPEQNYEGTWVVSSISGKTKNDPALISMDKFYKGRWIQYNKDSSYTTNINGQYDFGKYKLNFDNPQVVMFKSFREDEYSINTLYDKAGKGIIIHNISVPEMTGTQEYKIECRVRDYKFRDSKFNTYAVENNYWRLPAEQSENDSLLTVRLINHIDFWLAYLNTAEKLELNSFDYSNLNSCFLFSNYGIQILNYKKWENTFKSLFYKREEAEQAYKILTKAIYKCTFEKNDNAYKQGINLFGQLKYQLSETNKIKVK